MKFLILFLPILLFNIFWLNKEISSLVEVATVRKGILNAIESSYPDLPDKVIFYTESDSSFYGLPADVRIMPFQSGFGQTLLMWYYPNERFPAELFQNRFLWKITDEGYRQIGNRGFGYFRNFERLTKSVSENKIAPESVFAFSYTSVEKKITDITHQTMGELVGLAAPKSEVDLREANVNFSHNPAHGFLALDGKRNTYWSSEKPYAIKPQYFDVDFRREVKVAQIKLDSFENRDQNEVGYAVYLSQNGKDWQEVLKTIRRTPRQDGIVSIYLPKSKTRFLRVEQIGEHEYAPWVIHELEIYAAIN